MVRKVSHERPQKKRKADRWDIEAKKFIEQNPNWDHRKTGDVESLSQFLGKSSVSLLALRSKDAVTFLDILEKVCASRTYGPGSQCFHWCRLRAVTVILWLHRMKSGATRSTFAGCHIGRSSILVPFISATSKISPRILNCVPTVEEDHRNPRRAGLERCAVRSGVNPTGQSRWLQSRLYWSVNNRLFSPSSGFESILV